MLQGVVWLIVGATVGAVAAYGLVSKRDPLGRSSRLELERANRELKRELSIERVRPASDAPDSVVDLRGIARRETDNAVIDLTEGSDYDAAEIARLEGILIREIDLFLEETARDSG